MILQSAQVVGQGSLPSPINSQSPFRVVFFVDQSHSMKFSGCSTDLDGQNPTLNSDGSAIICNETDGNDVAGNRFTMIRSWLRNLAFYYAKSPNLVKVAVIPFGGGFFHNNILHNFNFISLNEAQDLVDKMETQQRNEHPSDVGQKKMGNTVPRPYLKSANSNIHTMIKNEMNSLKDQGAIDGSSFEYVMITDGMFKPVAELIKKAQDLAYCNTAIHADEFYYCNTLIPNNFELAFGKVADNDPDKIAADLKAIYDLPKIFEGSSMRLRLVRTQFNPNASFNNKNKNLLDLVSNKLRSEGIESPEIIVTNADIPFQLYGKMEDQLTYYIQNFYVIGQNSFVNEFGKLVSDSDGDGVSDSDEILKGWDPLAPRSAVSGNNGRCLDGIFKNFGCERISPCNKDLDLDGDGLNQCEEMTIGTNEKNPDTDGDSIPDFLEARGLGMNPKFNESSKSSAGDGMTDFQHFMSGVHTQVSLDSVSDQSKIKFQLKNFGKSPRVTSQGRTIFVMNYKLDIINLPLVPTQNVSQILNQSYIRPAVNASTAPIYLQDPRDQIGAQNHSANSNQFLFLVKMGTLEKPDVTYWLAQTQSLVYSAGSGMQAVDLNFELFHQLQLMKVVK